ncbi:glutaredoxin 3 [Thioclava sp. F42-5]|uniref:glutaredoxin 3 n=1 Tax=Thioclava sp. F42-5 TaxID=1973005 RepID=UPI000B53E024|nr:glutaredoxin 3 [Thioclava sp. F42-5]OWY08340.1 glutaredoxin 3 [Thioclava sp. F42-5]
MKRVEIYVTSTCPFCIRAKRLLDKKGISYEETDVAREPQLRAAMTQRANGRRTVPQIFIGGEPIGGCDELHALEHAGKLDQMLAG